MEKYQFKIHDFLQNKKEECSKDHLPIADFSDCGFSGNLCAL